jgi:thiol:disulfide interchange protein DsbC
MLKKISICLSVMCALAAPSLVLAAVDQADDALQKQIEKSAHEIFKKIGGTVKSIKPSPVKGLYEILVEKDGRKGIVYLDEAGKHLLQGVILDLDVLQPVYAHPQDMLPSKQPSSLDVTKIPLKNAVVMGNPKGSKKLYVFSDPDCPYCQKGHVELKKLAGIAPDVAIYVMLFPLPMHPGAFDKARSILESRDPAVLDKAFGGKEVPKPTQESSKAAIDENIAFANANGISGTPTMVMPDGKIEVGMRDAETLKGMLEVK